MEWAGGRVAGGREDGNWPLRRATVSVKRRFVRILRGADKTMGVSRRSRAGMAGGSNGVGEVGVGSGLITGLVDGQATTAAPASDGRTGTADSGAVTADLV